MLSLDLTHQAKGFLEQLDPKRFRQVVKKIFFLMENPRPPDSKPLQGSHFWRADIGEYRIVYRVEGSSLKVALIDKRNDDEVYKKTQPYVKTTRLGASAYIVKPFKAEEILETVKKNLK